MTKKKKPTIRKVDIDRAAIINERIKSLSDELKTLKQDFGAALKPEEFLEGFAFQVEKSALSEVSGKVDYRNELIKLLGKNGVSRVERMEKDAAEIKTTGSACILFRANPNANESVLSKSLKMRSLVLKAIAEGRDTSEVSGDLEKLANGK